MLVIVGGCVGPRYGFESRPQLPPATTQSARCYQEARFELAAASGTFTSYTGGQHVAPTSSGYVLRGATTSESFGESGLVVYQAGRRLDVREALRRLRDPAADRAYEQVLAPTASDHAAYPRWRALSILTTVASSAAIVGGAVWATATGFEDDPPLYVMLGGTVGLLVSLVPTVAAYRTKNGHYLHERKLTFFHDRAFWPTLASAARAANERAATGCGATADLPLTPRAARMVQGP